MLNDDMKKEAMIFDDYLRDHCQKMKASMPAAAEKLYASMQYSLFNGGKRFRPVLSLFAARALNIDVTRVLPFAAAVEMIHTYSLIHDDLPCMDNDDVRRGQPTNHIEFGEDTALLAGDALLTEANALIAHEYKRSPEMGMELIRILTEAAGIQGMISGQIMDLQEAANEGKSALDIKALQQMQALKTGALIRVSVEGVAVIARLSPDERLKLRSFGEDLGKAFQIADDIEDYLPESPELSGYPAKIGFDETKALLDEVSDRALLVAESFGSKNHLLSSLVKFNQTRVSPK